MDHCKTILYYRESLLKNKKVFDLHVQILRNALTRKIIKAYLVERQGYFAHQQKILARLHTKMAPTKKFIWLTPFVEKRPDRLEPDITRLLHDKDLRKKLMTFLDFTIKEFKC